MAGARAAGLGAVATALCLFAVIVAILFLVEDPRVAPSFLLVVPIAILTCASGAGAGFAAAAVALSVVVVHWDVESVDGSLAAIATRAVVFFSIPPLIVWAARGRTSSGITSRPDVATTRVTGSPNGERTRPGSALSDRELEVLRLLALGHTNAEIAERLYLSVRTVESHRARIQRKIGRSGRPNLVSYALENGLLGERAGDSPVAPGPVRPA